MTIVIYGKPMTWARARVNKRGKFFTPADREARMAEFTYFWRAAGHERIEKPTGIAVIAEFVFDRPDEQFGTGRNLGVLKERYRYARPGRGKNGGDIDNLIKLPMDALSHVAYSDDSQIAELHVAKRYVDVEANEKPYSKLTLLALDAPVALPEPVAEPAQLALEAA